MLLPVYGTGPIGGRVYVYVPVYGKSSICIALSMG